MGIIREPACSISTMTELIYLKKNEFTPGSETLNTEHLNIYKIVWRGAPPVSFWTLQELMNARAGIHS